MTNRFASILRQLDFQWMNLVGPSCICSETIHPGLTCLQQFLLKFKMTLHTISKFYVLFHLIPYILKVKKMIREGRLLKSSIRTILNFLGSLLFMANLVCGLKATLCSYSNLNLNIDGTTFLLAGFPTGISIFWQSPTRREQITYYAFTRSLRAVYVFLKRRNIINVIFPNQLLIILLFGALSFFYTQNQNNLKYSNIFEGLWGKM